MSTVHDKARSEGLDKSWGLDGFVKPMRYDEVQKVIDEHSAHAERQ